MLALRRFGWLFAFVLAACSSPPPGSDVAPEDFIGEPAPDRAGSSEPSDGGAHVRLGTLLGACGTLRAELTSPDPMFERNELTFVAGEAFDAANLSPGGQRLMTTPNAGGSSFESEVMSFEVLHACEGAALLKTETEVAYDDGPSPAAITDYLAEIDGKKVGVSVTRAYRPSSQPFSDAEAKALLEKKLEGVAQSSARVASKDRWVKQILHVFASNAEQADAVARAWPTLDANLRADTIVLLTQTTGGGFVYCNPDPPLGSECL